jgi:hypothetical protein
MGLVNGPGAVIGKSRFDPADLGRPPSAARALAEHTEQRILKDIQDQLDRLLPPGVDLGRIRPPNGHHALDHLANFARRLEELASRYSRLVQGSGSSTVLAKLWEAWNGFEGCRSLEDVHAQLKILEDNLAETVRHMRQRLERTDPQNPSGPKIIPASCLSDFQLLLDIVTELFAIRRVALIGELNEIESELCDNWFARGSDAWILLESKWQEWAND